MVWRTSIRMPQIFSVTVSSTEACVTSRKTPPMVSYDSYRLTYPRMLYCSMQSEMDAIWDAKSRHWHFPRLRSLLASANETSMAQRIPIALLAVAIEKEFNGGSGKGGRNLTVMETIMFGVLDMTFPFGFLGYDGIRRHGSIGRVILGLGHFDHTQ